MTLHYEFPHIHHINDVLAVIKDDPDFIVVKKEAGVTLVRYVVSGKSTFPAVNESDPYASIRRECRGLVFDTATGELVSRRLHKFFNLGERSDTTTIDLTRPHVVLEKLDGSMITPFPVMDGSIRWGTKMGITDTSMQAECYVAQHPEYLDFASDMIDEGKTPIFEWCSRQQKIVLDYAKDQLVLLHIRDNLTGDYLPRPSVERLGEIYSIPVVKVVASSVGNLDEFIATIRAMEDAEGVIIQFDDGHMVKVKSDWYVALHRAKAAIETRERDVVHLILEDKIDDLMPLLEEKDKARLTAFASDIYIDIDKFRRDVLHTVQGARSYGWDRKKFAAINKGAAGSPHLDACFRVWDIEADDEIKVAAHRYAVAFILKYSLTNNSYRDYAKRILRTAKWSPKEIG